MNASPEITDICRRLARAAGLPGTDVPDSAHLDWPRWLDLAEANRLIPFIAQRAATDLPPEIRDELDREYAREGRYAFLRAVEMKRILSIIPDKDDFVVLKGAALIGELYGESAERVMWDVDVLFRDGAALARAEAALNEHGFAPGKGLPEHHHAPALEHEFRVLGVELHTNLVTPPLPEGLIQALWERRTRNAPGFWVHDPVGQLIHHAIHAFNDPLKSPLLRNVFETAWLAQRLTPAQQVELKSMAERWSIVAEIARGTAFARELFGSPGILDAPRETFYEFWCRHRLEWGTNLNFAGRVLRHVAHDHIRKMRRGAGPRNIFPIVGIFFGWFFQSLEAHLLAATRPLRQARGHVVRVDDCIIFGSARTGEVHLLNPEAARAFTELRGPRAVLRMLQRRGVLTSTSDSGPPRGPGAPLPS